MAPATDAQKALAMLEWAVPARDIKPAVSLPDLLVGLQLLASDEDRKKAVDKGLFEGTPSSMQVIKSGATGIAKGWSNWTAGVGGLTGVTAAVVGALKGLTTGLGDPVVVALIGGGALILSATAIALAMFVKGDLEARGRATAARHAGRAEVAAMFLRATSEMEGATATKAEDGLKQEILAALVAFPGKVSVMYKGSSVWNRATAVCRSTEGFQIRIDGKDWKPLDQISQYTTDPK